MPAQDGLFAGIFSHGNVDVSDAAWLRAMLEVESALARALEQSGLAPDGSGAAVTLAAKPEHFDPAELGRLATQSGNPVPALVRRLTELVPPDAAAAVHQGATSQDIIDTALMLLARAGTGTVLAGLASAAAAAARLAAVHESTVMSGRTLLQQAVPVTFGLVAATWLTALDEARQALSSVRTRRLAIQFGGAAGTLAPLGTQGPAVASLLARELGLASPVLPWHTNRQRIIELASALAQSCAATGKIARDVTLLSQTELAEVRESSAGTSSTMPHKRNPTAAIMTLGCTRQAPALLATVVASAEQELQRAAGAWHAEWQPLTSLLTLTASAASWCAELLAGLQVDAQAMRANLDATGGLPMAEHVASLLAPRLGRTAAHDLIAQAVRDGRPLREVLRTGTGLSAEEIDAALDPEGYLGATSEFIHRARAAHDSL